MRERGGERGPAEQQRISEKNSRLQAHKAQRVHAESGEVTGTAGDTRVDCTRTSHWQRTESGITEERVTRET